MNSFLKSRSKKGKNVRGRTLGEETIGVLDLSNIVVVGEGFDSNKMASSMAVSGGKTWMKDEKRKLMTYVSY